MAAITIHSDFVAQKTKVSHSFHCFPIIWHEVMGLDAMILVFWCWTLSQLFHFPLSLSSRDSLVLFHWDGVMLQFLNFFYIRGKIEKTTYLHVISKTIWYSIWYIVCVCNSSIISIILFGFPSGSMIKNPHANARGNASSLQHSLYVCIEVYEMFSHSV